jgi:hypothetical protein
LPGAVGNWGGAAAANHRPDDVIASPTKSRVRRIQVRSPDAPDDER